jgi:hypothetical protein
LKPPRFTGLNQSIARLVSARATRRVAEVTCAVCLALVCAAWALKLWTGSLAFPLRYGPIDDTKFYLMLVKTTLTHGWYQPTSDLGAPFGQTLYDFPQGVDNLNFALIRFIGLFTSDVAVATNVFFLLTFALTSLSCYLVLRRLAIAVVPALIGAVVFALLPYHFFRGESQLLLSAYYSVPLTGYLFITLVGARPLFSPRVASARRLWPLVSATSGLTLGLCIIIGSDNLYYATFALLLLTVATPIAAWAHRSRVVLYSGTATVGIILAVFLVNLGPSLVYRAEHGPNRAITRTVRESEERGLKLTNLLLPVVDHRLPALAHVTTDYASQEPGGFSETVFQTLGTLGDLGFVWLLIVSFPLLIRRPVRPARQFLEARAGAGVLAALLIGMTGGLSGLIAFAITPTIRGWSRLSLFVAFFSLLAVASVLQNLAGRLRKRRFGGILATVLLAGAFALGVWDETSDYFVPPYRSIAQEWRSDEAFVGGIETELHGGGEIFELPYVPFPEGYPPAPGWLPDSEIGTSYELLRGYLHSSHLRWSFGAMKGRPTDWSAQLANKPLALVVPAVTAAGFSGIYVDPRGYRAEHRSEVRRILEAILHARPLVSPDGDLWFFDLRAYERRLARNHAGSAMQALRVQTLYPLRASCHDSEVTLVNPSSAPQRATFNVVLRNGGEGEARVSVAYPDGATQQLTVTAEARHLARRMVLPAGSSVVRMSVTAGSPSANPEQAQPSLVASAFEPFAPTRASGEGSLPAGVSGRSCSI